MCQRTDSEDIAETEFCLNPNEREENKVIHQGWLTAPLIKIIDETHLCKWDSTALRTDLAGWDRCS